MNSYRARRATTDDLQQLMALWKDSQFPAVELEKRFTEFQVVEGAGRHLEGAIGLQIAGLDAKVHSETFADFGLTDILRPMLWERVQVVAKNHGLFRLWTDETAPFWKKDAGFVEPSEGQKAPESFGAHSHRLLMLQIRNENATPDTLEKELAGFLEAEHAKRDKLVRQAKAMKFFATILAALLFLFTIVMGVHYLKGLR